MRHFGIYHARTLAKKRMPGILVAISQGQHIPDILHAGHSFDLSIVLGHFGNRVMADPFSFHIYFSDKKGKKHRTTIKIRPATGDVVSLKHKRLGMISSRFA